jgi:hypothetical protein
MHHDPELDGPEVASASPRSFAYLLAAVALIVGIYPLAAGGAVRPLFLALAALAFLIGKFAAALLSAPTRWWIGLGNVLSRIVSPVALLVVFGLMSAYGKRPTGAGATTRASISSGCSDHVLPA